MNGENNSRFLDERPRLRSALESAVDAYDFIPARSGALVPVRRDDGRSVFSRYDPLREAQRWLDAQALRPVDLPVFLGFSPFVLEACPVRPIIFVERDRSLLRALLAKMDLSDRWRGVSLVLDDDGIALANAVRAAFDFFSHTQVRILRCPHIEEDPWVLRMTETALAIQRESSLNALTIAAQNQGWIAAAAANLPFWMDSPDAGAVLGRLEGETAILVAAGPSLERNISLLSEVRGRALVIAVDTALRRFDLHGLVPDLVVAVDTNEVNSWDVRDVGARGLSTLLVADQVAHPALVRAFQGRRLFMRTINFNQDEEGRVVPLLTPLDLFLFEIAGSPVTGTWQSGGSVSTNALYLAWTLGIRRVILVGQDLAFTGNRRHARGVAYEDAWVSGMGRFSSRETLERPDRRGGDITVESWNGGTVRTSNILREYLHWFERSIEHGFARSMEIIDATEGGAAKRGTKKMLLKDALAFLDEDRRPGEKLKKCIDEAPRTGRAGWRDRIAQVIRIAKSVAENPERVETDLPLARWIVLSAHLGSHELEPAARNKLLRSAHSVAAQFLATVLQKTLDQ